MVFSPVVLLVLLCVSVGACVEAEVGAWVEAEVGAWVEAEVGAWVLSVGSSVTLGSSSVVEVWEVLSVVVRVRRVVLRRDVEVVVVVVVVVVVLVVTAVVVVVAMVVVVVVVVVGAVDTAVSSNSLTNVCASRSPVSLMPLASRKSATACTMAAS